MFNLYCAVAVMSFETFQKTWWLNFNWCKVNSYVNDFYFKFKSHLKYYLFVELSLAGSPVTSAILNLKFSDKIIL